MYRNVQILESGSLLQYFVVRGKSAIVQKLLKKGFNAKVTDSKSHTPYFYAKRFRHVQSLAMDEETIKDLKKADQEYSKSTKKTILFGHRLSLKGKRFEGYSNHKMFYKHIINSIKDWIKYNPIDNAELILEALNSAIDLNKEQAEKRIKENRVIVVPSGWHKHAVSFVAKNNVVFRINLGTGSGDDSGIVMYYFEKEPSKETFLQVITTLLENRDGIEDSKNEAIQFFNKDIIEQLNLKRFFQIPDKQAAGNCLWASTLYAFCALLLSQKLTSKTTYTFNDAGEAWDSIYETFSNWYHSDLADAITDFEFKLKDLFSIVEIDKIYEDMLIRAVDGRSLPLILRILRFNPNLSNWMHPTTQKSLLDCLYEKQLWAGVYFFY